MLREFTSAFPDFLLDFFTFSDVVFYNLLGLLLLLLFTLLIVPLHKMMICDLFTRNEIVDLAEADGCTEFEVFTKALQYFYGGSHSLKRAERDFVVYICNWPDNYVLPYYVRLYLEMRERDGSVSDQDTTTLSSNKDTKKRYQINISET